MKDFGRMLYSQVTIEVGKPDRTLSQVWFVFASEHADIRALHDELEKNGTVYGHRLQTVPVGPGHRREVDRTEFLIGRMGLVSIKPLRCTVKTTTDGVVR